MNKGRIKKTVKRRATILGIFFFIVFIVLIVTSLSYVYQIRNLKNEERKLEEQLKELKLSEEELSVEINRLKDPNYIAKYAREKYYYTKDGEYVIKIDESTSEKIESITENIKVYYIIGGISIGISFLGLVIFIYNKNKKEKTKK